MTKRQLKQELKDIEYRCRVYGLLEPQLGGHMSTMVGYKCLKCGESCGHLYNRGHDRLRMIVKVWPHVANLLRVLSHLPSLHQDCIEVVVGGSDVNSEIVEFLHDHYNHGVCLLDEYGHEEPIDV